MPNPLDLERVRATATPAIETLIEHAREKHSGTDLHRISDEAENELDILRTDLPAAVEEIAALRAEVAAARKLLDKAFNNLTEFGGIDDQSRVGWWLQDYDKFLRNEQERK